MNKEPQVPEREVDHLVYVGNSFPRSLRLIWTIFLVAGFIYLVIHMIPDLRLWLAKFGG